MTGTFKDSPGRRHGLPVEAGVQPESLPLAGLLQLGRLTMRLLRPRVEVARRRMDLNASSSPVCKNGAAKVSF